MTTFTRIDQPFKVQASAGSASPDFEVSTNGAININLTGINTSVVNVASKVSASSANFAAITSVSTLTITGGLVFTSAFVSAAASPGTAVTATHYVKFTVGANTIHLLANISAF